MPGELVTSIDAAGPTDTIRIEANLISFGRVDFFKSDLCRPDDHRVAINDFGTPDKSAACVSEQTWQAANVMAANLIIRK